MKVKSDIMSSLNKKKNAVPSKLLKQIKTKSSFKKSSDKTKQPLSKDILKLVKTEDINAQVGSYKNPQLQCTEGKIVKPKHLTNSRPMSLNGKSLIVGQSTTLPNKSKNLQTLFDFAKSQKQNVGLPNYLKSKSGKRGNNKGGLKHVNKKNSCGKYRSSEIVINKRIKANLITNSVQCNLQIKKVADIARCLLKRHNAENSGKAELLDVPEPVFLQVECIKIPICKTKQFRFKLPHPLVGQVADILLITPDLKGHKIYPEKAIEYYEELLSKQGITFINKVMPLRMVKKEYSQYEMKRKLVDQFDLILADCRVLGSIASALGKFVLYKHMMPIPVKLEMKEEKLKNHLLEAISKTQMTVKSNGNTSIVQIGHTKMRPKEIAENILEVGKILEGQYPGGWKNIRSIVIKTAKSTALPIYLSLLSPNEVRIPVEVPKKPAAVEGELSTVPGANVVVTADGKVILKKVEEVQVDNSKDDEILEEAEKYIQSSKTVRHDESSDEEEKNLGGSDSDNEGEAITAAMEKKLMNKYEKNLETKGKKKANEGGSDSEEQEDDEEEEEMQENEDGNKITSIPGKKRKIVEEKKLNGSLVKQFKPMGNTKKAKSHKNNEKTAVSGLQKQQMRGSRGGKKNKMSKDQRKALIKRKKAGKK